MASHDISVDRLLEACATGDLALLQTLLQHPSYIAVALSTPSQTEVLTAHGEEIRLTHKILNLVSMFNTAARAGSVPIVNHLLAFAQTRGIPHTKLIRRDAICAAISANTVPVFRELYAAQPDIINMDMGGHTGTPLTQALLRKDNDSLIHFLLGNGSNPNTHTGVPGPHLRSAAQHSSLSVIELLIQHGAEIAQSGALHYAAENSRIDAMALLVRYGADVNEQLFANLRFSARYRTRIKKELGITSDVSGEKRPSWGGETPLHYSVLARQRKGTEWLIRHGADASITDSKGWSATDMARRIGDAEILAVLASN